MFRQDALLAAESESVSWVSAFSNAAIAFVLRQCLFLIWSGVLVGLALKGHEVIQKARRSCTRLPSKDLLWHMLYYQVAATFLNGLVLEMIPWGVSESSSISFAIFAFRIQGGLSLVVGRLIFSLSRSLPSYPRRAAKIGQQRTSTKRPRACRVKWKGVLLLCNVVCAQAIPMLPYGSGP